MTREPLLRSWRWDGTCSPPHQHSNNSPKVLPNGAAPSRVSCWIKASPRAWATISLTRGCTKHGCTLHTPRTSSLQSNSPPCSSNLSTLLPQRRPLVPTRVASPQTGSFISDGRRGRKRPRTRAVTSSPLRPLPDEPPRSSPPCRNAPPPTRQVARDKTRPTRRGQRRARERARQLFRGRQPSLSLYAAQTRPHPSFGRFSRRNQRREGKQKIKDKREKRRPPPVTVSGRTRAGSKAGNKRPSTKQGAGPLKRRRGASQG
mmetsp:Transcript_4745/g.10391  ORF Transcript_4745/g.10391 Transcript_4745/m.10391 type:complete len:260 (+) Transcript_4745:444-1223(+)